MSSLSHTNDGDRVGWTKAEYDAAPEMANRLHRRILGLEDEVCRLRYLQTLVLAELMCGDVETAMNLLERDSADA